MNKKLPASLLAVAAVLTTVLAAVTAAPSKAKAAPPVAADPAAVGSWSAPFTPAGPSSRVIGVHSVMLYTGNVLLFGNLRPTVGYVYNPATGSATETDPPVDVACGAVVPLNDGRVLVVGGHAKGAKGIDNVLLFDPVTLTWTPPPPSPQGRYYPTATRLPDGRVLISGGFTSTGANNTNVEVWTPPPPGGNVGTITVVGQHLGGLFPHQWVLPDGRVLEITSKSTSLLNTSTWTWTTLKKPLVNHGSGEGAVQLPGPPSGSTDFMLVGGLKKGNAIAQAEYVDASTPSAGWSALASLPQPRAHMSPVLLPDGTLLGVGGNSSGNFSLPQFTALRYDPQANTWTTLAAQTERRGYHSSAVLLPDGRVLSAGDTGAGGGGNKDELFSPPYLFQGARPTITAAPSQVSHGASFTITTPDTTSHAVLMAPGAATHTTDMNEQNIALQTTPGPGALTAVAPSGTVGLTGWCMLFLVSNTGIPSVANWIHVG